MKRIKIVFLQKEWEDNLGILWISAVLRKHDFDTRVIVDGKHAYREIQDVAPDVIGYKCMTGDQSWIIASINKIKSLNLNSKILVGGSHPTFFPNLIENSLLDVICRGEGEYATLEYVQSLEEGKDPYHIQNLSFNVDGEIIENDLRPFISGLDELPFPDRSYYDRYQFLASNPYKIMITGRGCPFKCTFCYNHALQILYGQSSKYIRRRSVDNVIEELLEMKHKWGIDEIRFSDDHFTFSARWLKEFSSIYKKEIGRPYSCNSRADVLDEEKVSYLKESGCRLVCFGIETGREELRNKVLKKGIKDEHIVRAARLLKKYKIKFLTSNIIGLPHETEEDAWETIRMNQEIETDLPWFSMLQYYPGTQIYQKAASEGLLDDFDMDKLGSYFKNDYLRQDNIAALQNIHSFSIITSRHKRFEPFARVLVKSKVLSPIYKFIFKLSYLTLTIKRANFKFFHMARWFRYYLKKSG